MPEAVTAVVVTYNRKDLLRECLPALESQTRPVDRIIVVDNASTDGTREMVRSEFPSVELLALAENVGGAGGFHEGLKASHAGGADWTWLMDDDTIARPDALEQLLAAPAALAGVGDPWLLASKAVWDDGRLHPMNAPHFERTDVPHIVASCDHGFMPLRTATFVSLLVSRRAVERYGLPLKHYFIWSDDIEYTARILRDQAGYLVPTSVVHHKTKSPYTAISSTGDRFYYHVRNTLYMLRGSAWNQEEKLGLMWKLTSSTYGYLRHNAFKPHNLAVVGRGVRDGLRPARA